MHMEKLRELKRFWHRRPPASPRLGRVNESRAVGIEKHIECVAFSVLVRPQPMLPEVALKGSSVAEFPTRFPFPHRDCLAYRQTRSELEQNVEVVRHYRDR